MSVFTPIPLGQPIPASPHGVSCSLPTMHAVRGYEEKDPAVVKHLTSGYPRFVVHPFARQLGEALAARHGLAGQKLWLTSSARMAAKTAAYLGTDPTIAGVAVFQQDGVDGVVHAPTPEATAKAKSFLQNIGGFLSSREAEDDLVRLGLKTRAYAEMQFSGDAPTKIRHSLLKVLPGAHKHDIFLAPSGMNAVYSAFRAAADLQAARGRTVWIQLGWLYLDTIAILKKFTATPGDYVHFPNVFDRAGLEKLFIQQGQRLAGLVTEIPTNPLIQTPDVASLADLCRRHSARLILDPSVASIYSVNLLPHADVLVSILTKYTASEGDVIAGVAVVNPAGPDAGELRTRIEAEIEPLYPRDAGRLAAQIDQTENLLTEITASVPKVVEFLSQHPKVKEVFWALQPNSKTNFTKIARRADSTGGMISFSLKGELAPFYDRLRLAKGPSFGMKTTLICPFMFLAHYDLVSTAAGRAELLASGIDPNLLRLCLGVEPVEDIIAALAEALE